ncbi:uncharacterized protein EV420DRAFT_1480833 [Desarmillaria tabescens]|uniref:Uncharacterized protein n=1 Tax=Armillaria tabescens TaxID=1929756 RepID=A0AA39KCJ7_ARMTA|nr:uncharacterized protein EV420DRAFT_1480833 [Desarmillaria tabescens]KAK0457361.1 hypothetical protein EV420DRAFT_1480833 [Desarmillaria tabescens]
MADIFQVVYGSSNWDSTLVSLEPFFPSAAIDVVEPIVFETMVAASISEPSLTPALTTPINSLPDETPMGGNTKPRCAASATNKSSKETVQVLAANSEAVANY